MISEGRRNGDIRSSDYPFSMARQVPPFSPTDKFNADRFVAIRPGGRNDSTETHVVWETTRGLSEIASALLYRGRIHLLKDGCMWTILDPRTGERLLDRERIGIGGQAVASPVAANGHIYVVNEPGCFAVLKAGDSLNIVSTSKLGESVRSNPAIAGDTLYVRGADHLWAFRNSAASKLP